MANDASNQGDDGASPVDGSLPAHAPPPAGGQGLIGVDGGSVTTSDGLVTIDVPAGALAGDTTLTIAPVQNAPPGFAGTVYEIGPTGTQFSSPAKLTFKYDPAALSGMDPNDLQVVTESGGAWTMVGVSSTDQSTNTVSALTLHLSQYSVAFPACGSVGGYTLGVACDRPFQCTSAVSGFNACIIPCVDDDDCEHPFLCARTSPGAPVGRCINPPCGSCRQGAACNRVRACGWICGAPNQTCPLGQNCLWGGCFFHFCLSATDCGGTSSNPVFCPRNAPICFQNQGSTPAPMASSPTDGGQSQPTEYPSIYLSQSRTITVSPVGSGYSYTVAVPPQGATRYDATLTLTPTVSGKKYRARLSTTCSQVTQQPDEVSSLGFANGDISFSWSAQLSTQFVQIATDETAPFEMTVTMTGALQ
jgi:hypothetical protein